MEMSPDPLSYLDFRILFRRPQNRPTKSNELDLRKTEADKKNGAGGRRNVRPGGQAFTRLCDAITSGLEEVTQ